MPEFELYAPPVVVPVPMLPLVPVLLLYEPDEEPVPMLPVVPVAELPVLVGLLVVDVGLLVLLLVPIVAFWLL
jgi:hypothetical protein